jgi:hypothetical protein
MFVRRFLQEQRNTFALVGGIPAGKLISFIVAATMAICSPYCFIATKTFV